jgi:serine/threonine protein kinase
MVRRKSDSKLFAMKALDRTNLQERQREYLMRERRILECVQSPFIAKLNYAFCTPEKLFFVIEYAAGGELLFHLIRWHRFSDHVVQFIVAEIILALESLHELHILYRDIKPENILLDGKVSYYY